MQELKNKNGFAEILDKDIQANLAKMEQEKVNGSNDILISKRANEWLEGAKNKPEPVVLCDQWCEHEMIILFGDTGIGKTIKAVQDAEEISKKQPVLYLDFELSDIQFYKRYSENGQYHKFNDNFIRCELNPDYDFSTDKDWEVHIISSVKDLTNRYNAKVVIIDNITYLKNNTERAKDAIPLMQQLNRLKKQLGLSMMVVAHTPKRDMSRPLSINDVSGSKMLANFCDGIIGIGESHRDKSLRYIKQLKARSSEIIYHSGNVKVVLLEKVGAYTQMSHVEFAPESEQLKEMSKEETADLDSSIIYLKDENPDLSNQQIADRLNTNRMKVKRVLDKHLKIP